MKKLFIIAAFFITLCARGQTYNPGLHTLTNKALGVAQAVPTDARSYYYDSALFIYRPYQSAAEVLSYLNLSKFRVGNFPIFISSGVLQPAGTFTGGNVTEYWFRDGVLNSNLVVKTQSDSTLLVSVAGKVNISDTAAMLSTYLSYLNDLSNLKVDKAGGKAQIGLGNADNTSDANKPISTLQQAALDLKVDKNGTDRLITDAEVTKLSNTTGTNSGDQDLSGIAANTAAIAGLSSGVENTSSTSFTPLAGTTIVNIGAAGTYTNLSGLVITSADLLAGVVQARKESGAWVKKIVTVDLSAYPLILDSTGIVPGIDLPVTQWIGPRGISELTGNSTYTNVGIMLSELLTNNAIINRVVLPAWGGITSAITVRIYKGAAFSNNPSSLTLLEEKVFAAGTFNTTSNTTTTIDLVNAYRGRTGEYVEIFIATTAGTNATVSKWTVAASSGTARRNIYQVSSTTNIWTTGWSALSVPSNGSPSFLLQYIPPKIAALEATTTANTANILSNTNALASLSSTTKPNVAGTLAIGYIEKVAGIFTSHASYRSTNFIAIEPLYTVRRLGSALNTVGNASAVSLVAFYDSSRVYLGQLLANITTDYSFVPNDYYPTARYIKVTSTLAAGLTLYITPTILTGSVQGLSTLSTSIATLQSKTLKVVDYASLYAKVGFYNTSGGIGASSNWRYVDPVECKEGDIFTYKGITSSVSSAVVGWNADFSSVTILYGNLSAQTTQLVTVPAGIVWIAASSRMLSGDVFQFSTETVNIPSGLLNIETIPEYYMPYKAWGKQGDEFRMNPFGIIAKHPSDRSIDLIWNLQEGNENFLQYTPSTEDTKDITLRVRDNSGNIISLGTTTLNVTHTTQSPATPQNFITFGNSLVRGVVSSGIEGAIANELSRRLTGVGTALLTGTESPAALSLSNIYFRGTLGDQPIKHEGRGGWSTLSYLTTSTGNAFWNPGTSTFDLGYYLTQNNFNSNQTTGGVDSIGSNLTIIIELIWNDVYDRTVADAITNMKQLINLIHTQKSGAKIKLLGIPGPPPSNKKSYTGTRNVSPESIMREAVIPYSRAWKGIADDPTYSSFVEFVSIAPFFFPEKSYPSVTVSKSARNAETIEVYTDQVHPISRGYAQVADVLFYNILFNYCKAL